MGAPANDPPSLRCSDGSAVLTAKGHLCLEFQANELPAKQPAAH